MIKVLIVDDSPVVREFLRDWLAAEKDLQVIGEAKDGYEAFEMTKALAPGLVIMDIMMPRMNGLDATEKIMAYCPTPVLIFSSVVNDREMNIVFEAISRGRSDVLAKPAEFSDGEKSVRQGTGQEGAAAEQHPRDPPPHGQVQDREARGFGAGRGQSRPGRRICHPGHRRFHRRAQGAFGAAPFFPG